MASSSSNGGHDDDCRIPGDSRDAEASGIGVRRAADLVIEVLSPRPRVGAVDEKLTWFERYGVRECWLVHQKERSIEVLMFGGGHVATRRTFTRAERIESSVLPALGHSPGSFLGY